MFSQTCKVCGGRKLMREFYWTGKFSRKTGKKLYNKKCKTCVSKLAKLYYKRGKNVGLCVDERWLLRQQAPQFIRKRVSKALREKGLKK